MKSIRDAQTTMKSRIFHGSSIYGVKFLDFISLLFITNPSATILIIASKVKSTVKQLSRYPMNIIIGSSGFASGLSITRVIELIKIKERMIPSNIAATRFVLF